ncbi:probable cytokinin riboside 5'-monophosphate phosphoribohydrolase LOGL8 [Citrus sinensis]|uniref:probable cytokinin riboside 5'-monophosphate phosphoribohydrolase LOGL8 n=1 Tax=Citrus sinensis TaxID=2711 RepID=UPI0022779B0A|nr:probable cytokinin riboside 5'-monophosphate phosphoribohydrolase LOGL8 [Citrus sinensis]
MAATSSSQPKNICVLSGFRYGKYKEFVQAAVDFGRAMAERKLHLVYGGGDRGLSKLISEAAFVRGSYVLGIIPKALKPLGCLPDPPTGEELVVSYMQERISEMLNHANAFIFLLGVFATLEALITFASWAHLNIHKKPIAYKLETDPMTLVLEWATDDDGSNSRKKCKLDLILRL